MTNTPGVLTDATADIAMSLILMSTRGLGAAERRVRTGTPWRWSLTAHLGVGLRGKTPRIVGPGAIGLATARRAKAFDMRVLLSGRSSPDPAVVGELDAAVLDPRRAAHGIRRRVAALPAHPGHAPSHRGARATADAAGRAFGQHVERAWSSPRLPRGGARCRWRSRGRGSTFSRTSECIPACSGVRTSCRCRNVGSATVETRTAMADLAVANVLAVLAGRDAVSPVGG